MTIPKYLQLARILAAEPALNKAELMERTGWDGKVTTNAISQLMRRSQLKSDQPPGRKSRQARYSITVTIESIEAGLGLPMQRDEPGVPLLERAWPMRPSIQSLFLTGDSQ